MADREGLPGRLRLPPPWRDDAAVIVHLDMDAFFASVEQRDVPSLKGKPVIVGGEREGRGIVSSASYEARAWGVHAAMSMREARRRCPHGIFIEGNWEKYVAASLAVFATCRRIVPSVEVVSIDECTLPLTLPWDEAVRTARGIGEEIFSQHGLTCSVGVAPNRILAKLASSMDKPRGFTVLHPRCLPSRIAPLSPSCVGGIGEKTQALLSCRGITTIGEMLSTPREVLRSILGPYADLLTRALEGFPDGEPSPVKERSLGHEYTFGHDVLPREEFWAVVARLCDQVSRRLRINRLQGSVVRVKLRWESFETHTSQRVVDADLHDPEVLRSIAKDLIRRLLKPARKIRLVGITAARLFEDRSLSCGEQLLPSLARRKALTKAIDRVWDRYGENSLVRASALLQAG